MIKCDGPVVGVVGSRGWPSIDRVFDVLDKLHQRDPLMWVVSGGCPNGADLFAELWSKKRGVPLILFAANWAEGKSAGFARNGKIIQTSDVVISFWDGNSRGTMDSMRKAIDYSKPLYVVTLQQPALRRVLTIEQIEKAA